MSKEVTTLDGITEGIWNVYTETSMYVVDLDNKRGRREPGKGLGRGNKSRNENMKAMPMLADGEWFKIIGIYCEVGPGMSILCEGLVKADIFTMRQTTWVRKIEKVEDNVD